MKEEMNRTDVNEENKPKNKIVPVIIIVVCILALTGTFLFAKFAPKKDKGFGKFGGPQGATVSSVKTTTAEVKTLHDYVNTNGEIKPQSSIDVFPSIGGKVYKVNVSLGSYVNKNDVIAEIDPSEPGVEYAHSPVYAPISGTVTSSPLKPGQKVNVSSVITTIGDVVNLQLSSSVPERYVAALKPGLKAEVVLEAYPGEVFNATVVRVSPVVDTASRTKEVILSFDKKDSRINAGMFAKVKLYTLNYSGAVVVPDACIVEKNGDNCVYVVKEDTVELRKVVTGKTVDNYIQLLEGVTAGETVVTEGMRAISNGAKIRDITNGFVPKAEAKPEESPAGEEVKADDVADNSKKSAKKASKKQK